MRKITVSDYQSAWKQMYEEEKSHLDIILKDEIISIHHIGSTAIEEMKAKPVIDLMAVVKNIEVIDEYDTLMKESGYEPKGENGLQGRRFYQKGGDARSHHLHLYEEGHPDVERHLVFRDYLRNNPCSRIQYGELKQTLAARNPFNMEDYIEGKDPLVKAIEKDAFEWRQGKQKDD